MWSIWILSSHMVVLLGLLYMSTPHNWAHVYFATSAAPTPVEKTWIFHLQAFTTTIVLCEQQSSVHSDHASSPCLPSSLLSYHSQQEQVTIGWNHQKPYTIPTSCAILPTMHTNSLHALCMALFTSTKGINAWLHTNKTLSTALSTAFYIQLTTCHVQQQQKFTM